MTQRNWSLMILLMILSAFIIFTLNRIGHQLTTESSRKTSIVGLPTIYVITGTYSRPTRMADITRLAMTLMHVPNLYWIVAEDGPTRSQLLADLLNWTNISHSYITFMYGANRYGILNKMAALRWIRQNAEEGVIYFADDDNAYDIRIFEEMRWTRKVTMWPVGCLTKFLVESPVVQNGKVIGWQYEGPRKFKVDFAGFAVSVRVLLENPEASIGMGQYNQESFFLNSLNLELEDIEPRASNCSKVLVWHVRTKNVQKTNGENLKIPHHYNNTNLPRLYENLEK
ncbi:galactosylgalactosylxylosylprotein 3-beta-glucuronosyltransferase 2-like [Tachypleus tridentatus]|uniref:galactosylgalactosylxylosylprotein 3-beta-glucuronosyltransferase 2-like n=1 Tax=Tachypleus tridentatus TaxID=6853 RepID=UPI003FD2FE2E